MVLWGAAGTAEASSRMPAGDELAPAISAVLIR
jgi:hypothetical protein